MCLFGYAFGKKGWKVCDLETRKFCVSRDVVFFEDKFPFHLEPKLSGSENVRPSDSGLLSEMANGPVLYPDEDTHVGGLGEERRTVSDSPPNLAHKDSKIIMAPSWEMSQEERRSMLGPDARGGELGLEICDGETGPMNKEIGWAWKRRGAR